jgi:hypothetical protein
MFVFAQDMAIYTPNPIYNRRKNLGAFLQFSF